MYTTVTKTKFLSLFALYTGNIIPKSLINLSVRKDHMFITKSKTGHPWNLAIIKHFYLTLQVTYHSHTIIQQWFTKHNDVKHLIHMDFLKHREDRNWIHSRNEAAEDEAVQDADSPPEPAQERDAI